LHFKLLITTLLCVYLDIDMKKKLYMAFDNKIKNGLPDLEGIFRILLNRIKLIFLGSNKNMDNSGGFSFYRLFMFIFFIITLIYIVLGVYIVKPAEQAVVTRLGEYVRVVEQGPHWIPIFIESKKIVNTEKLERSSHYGSSMLTRDENILTVEIEVQYRINDVEKYLFNLVEPDKCLKEAADSALRQVVGYSELDFLMTLGKERIAVEIHEQLQHILDSYNSGIHVAIVALKDVRIPNDVKSSFDDVIKAQEEKEQLKHQAEAFANKVIPEAKGEASRMLEAARAYKQEVIYLAEGDVFKFKLLLPEYQAAPKVTRIRLYMDTLETILSKTTKVLVDLNKNNSFIYLPVDKFVKNYGK